MSNTYENMSEICDAALGGDIDFNKLLNFIANRESAAYERGYNAATELYTALLTTSK